MRVVPAILAGFAVACGGVDVPPKEEPGGALDGLRVGALVAFTPADDILPSVSANGRYVLFASDQNGNLDVWVRDFASNSTYPITKSSSADDYDPRIAPDGERMAFVSRRSDAKGDIYVSDVDADSSAERITGDDTHDRQPVWAPDGETVYFTAARGIGREYIAKVNLDTKAVERVTRGEGFDPAVSPDGRYLVYTEPGRHPHLVALSLASGATRALTLADAPEGFASFVPSRFVSDGEAIVYVRFPDDDDGNATVDANDHASVWRIDVDLDEVFAKNDPAPATPVPLTDGNDDELFPTAGDGWLYITQGSVQQDVVRLPLDGIFPRYENPEDYLALAKTVEDPRTRWFVLRVAQARAPEGSLLRAQAGLQTANVHFQRNRPDLALVAFERVRQDAEGAEPQSALAALDGIARVEIAALRHDQLIEGTAGEDRDAVVGRAEDELRSLKTELGWSSRIAARIDLELAERLVDRGARVSAIEAFDRVVREYPGETFSAARASLRRIELLGIAHDPDAIGEAYRRIVERFPNETDVVREASQRIVSAYLADLGTTNDWTAQVDALRRIVPRFGDSPVRVQARSRLAQILEANDQLDAAALELAQIAREARRDRLTAARALVALASVEERRGSLDAAATTWREVRSSFADLPGFESMARTAITRVNLASASREERRGNFETARQAYRRVIENDLTQVRAHRRYLALSAATRKLDEAVDEAQRRAERSPGTPIARYAYGLALSWEDPPDVERAWSEIEKAIALNPQLAMAYVTRGWLREKRERSPSLGTRMSNWISETLGAAFGSIFDVEIGQQGGLELAIEDYKTALRLNPESSEPVAEAEILLNLGNAHYSLAEQTDDVSNMRIAFERYAELLRLGYTFKDPVVEALFWERLGRSAIWADEPAISAMATRRAIPIAERAGLDRRLAQLHGNLALAYATAGEDAYAERALVAFEGALAERDQEERLLIAIRDRARSRLGTIDARTVDSIETSLVELSRAREILAANKSTARGDKPDVWVGVVKNHTSAQYGFRARAELDVNLALAEIAHDALGEASRVEALRRRRFEVTTSLLETIPDPFYVLTQEPVALLQVRERVGLLTSGARLAIENGDVEEGLAQYDLALAELDRWRTETTPDRGAMTVDRGRLLAQRVEAAVRSGVDGGIAVGDLEMARQDILEDLDPVKTATEAELTLTTEWLDTLPETLTSTGALVRTASVATSAPRLALPLLDARAVRARLANAIALLHLSSAHTAMRSGTPTLDGLLGTLDGATARLKSSRGAYELAAREAAGAGPGRGGPILITALAGVAETSRSIGDRTPSLLMAMETTARDVAKTIGRDDLDTAVALASVRTSTASRVVDQALRARGPHAYATMQRAYEAVLARTASTAIGANKPADAISAIDRWLMIRATGTPTEFETLGRPGDREATRRYPRLLDRLAVLRADLARADVSIGPDAFSSLLRRIAETRAAIEEWETIAEADLSELALARVLAVPASPDVLPFELKAGEIVVAPVPLEGRLHLALVDSTTVAAELAVVDTGRSVAEVRGALEALWASLETGYADSASIEMLRAALFEPIAARLGSKQTIVFASALLGGPIPAVVVPDGGPALVHVSSFSALGHLKKAQLVGVEGTLVWADPGGTTTFDGGNRLSGAQLRSFRRRAEVEKLEPGEARSLEDRNAQARYAAQAVDTVVVDAEVRLEPGALTRSAIVVDTTTAADDTYSAAAADRFASEVPLEQLTIPARHLVLSRVSDERVGRGGPPAPRGAVLSLDLVLAGNGYATTLVIPERVSRESARRVVTSYLGAVHDKGPARALADALGEVRQADPTVDLVTLIGAPGLDKERTRAYAKAQLKAAQTYAVGRLRAKAYRDLVFGLERWIRIQFEAKKPTRVKLAYTALIGALSDRLGDHDRAVDAMERYVAYLESTAKSKKHKRALASTIVDLASLYSRAHDYEKAESVFEDAIERLRELGDDLGIARAWYKLARHYRDKLDLERAAQFFERSVEAYEKLGQYKKQKGRKKEADQALRQVGDLYLNNLSDPVRAQRAYRRALDYAKTDVERIDRTIDLARVGRRRGAFDSAAELAEAARRAAAEKGLGTRELSGIIEAANIAWYRGDYQRGEALCGESLAQSKRLYGAAAKKVKGAPKKADVQKLEIFARSVCGLVAMSQRDADDAIGHLVTARRIAQALDNDREVATQYNNLGRVYLEFGRLGDAIEAFRAAYEIDRRLDDRYALAYDLRNLGRALALEGAHREARDALTRGLEYAVLAKDKNNELRARFALAQLAQEQGLLEEARDGYDKALPIAERLEVRELAWQIHHALGVMDWTAGDTARAEQRFEKAVSIARSITGRATASDVGPSRFQAFDDLMRLRLDLSRNAEAFEVAELARSLSQVALLDDARVPFDREVLGLLGQVRASKTASVASAAKRELSRRSPRLFEMVAPVDVERVDLPDDAAVVVYRSTTAELVIFVLTNAGLEVRRVEIEGRAFDRSILQYAKRLVARADLTTDHDRLAKKLVEPIAPLLDGKRRVAFVLDGSLRYVAMPALPFGDGAIVDRFVTTRALHTRAALASLRRPLGPLQSVPIVAVGATKPSGTLQPLPFADKELDVIREELPGTTLIRGDGATSAALAKSMKETEGVLHFAGHALLTGGGGGVFDPLGGRLATGDGAVTVVDVLEARTKAQLIVLSACFSSLAPFGSRSSLGGDEVLSMAQAMQLAGARNMLATTSFVDDLSASILIKRFYRAAKTEDAASALRDARQAVRKNHPHPAWWATFALFGS